MKVFAEQGWPARRLTLVTAANFAVQVVLLFFFPLRAACHWGADGLANGWMNRYFYLLYFALPFAILWLLARRPRNPLVACFYASRLGGVVRTGVWLLAVLATWIPVYAVLLVPALVPAERQAAWISGMVYTVEAALGAALLLLAAACAVSWVRTKLHA